MFCFKSTVIFFFIIISPPSDFTMWIMSKLHQDVKINLDVLTTMQKSLKKIVKEKYPTSYIVFAPIKRCLHS